MRKALCHLIAQNSVPDLLATCLCAQSLFPSRGIRFTLYTNSQSLIFLLTQRPSPISCVVFVREALFSQNLGPRPASHLSLHTVTLSQPLDQICLYTNLQRFKTVCTLFGSIWFKRVRTLFASSACAPSIYMHWPGYPPIYAIFRRSRPWKRGSRDPLRGKGICIL